MLNPPENRVAHTPGPWVSKWRADVDEVYIIGPGKEPVATLIGFSSRPLAELEANGRLVAAAPDGLEAARFALSVLRANPAELSECMAIEKLEAFVTKAEGRQP